MRLNKRYAFTLTEVLLAVVIVGVIASLILPMVISNLHNGVLETTFAKEKQSLENSIKTLLVVENVQDYHKTMLYVEDDGSESVDYANTSGKFMKKFLRTSRDCGVSNGNCFATSYYTIASSTKKRYYPTYKGACATLKNGMSICMTPQVGATPIQVLIDLNGKKGPNVLNRDLRVFEIGLPEKTALNRGISGVEADYTLINFQSKCNVNGTYDIDLCCSSEDTYSMTKCCDSYWKDECCTLSAYSSTARCQVESCLMENYFNQHQKDCCVDAANSTSLFAALQESCCELYRDKPLWFTDVQSFYSANCPTTTGGGSSSCDLIVTIGQFSTQTSGFPSYTPYTTLSPSGSCGSFITEGKYSITLDAKDAGSYPCSPSPYRTYTASVNSSSNSAWLIYPTYPNYQTTGKPCDAETILQYYDVTCKLSANGQTYSKSGKLCINGGWSSTFTYSN